MKRISTRYLALLVFAGLSSGLSGCGAEEAVNAATAAAGAVQTLTSATDNAATDGGVTEGGDDDAPAAGTVDLGESAEQSVAASGPPANRLPEPTRPPPNQLPAPSTAK